MNLQDFVVYRWFIDLCPIGDCSLHRVGPLRSGDTQRPVPLLWGLLFHFVYLFICLFVFHSTFSIELRQLRPWMLPLLFLCAGQLKSQSISFSFCYSFSCLSFPSLFTSLFFSLFSLFHFLLLLNRKREKWDFH